MKLKNKLHRTPHALCLTLSGKRGTTDPVLLVGGLICAALIVILIITLYNLIIHTQVVGQASFVVKDAGSLIETAYASPESLRTSYDVPIGGDGFPTVGSFLLNGNDKEICIHPHSEDEMWIQISNKALSAWGVGVAVQSITKIRKEQKEYLLKNARLERNKLMLEMDRTALLKGIDDVNDILRPDFPADQLINKQPFLTSTNPLMIEGASKGRVGKKAAEKAAANTVAVFRDPDSVELLGKLYKEYPNLVKNADDAKKLAQVLKARKTQKGMITAWEFGEAGKALVRDTETFSKLVDTPAGRNLADLLESAPDLQKAGAWSGLVTETGTKTSVLVSGADMAKIEASDTLKFFGTWQGNEFAEIASTKYGEGLRRAMSNPDDAAEFAKVAKYNDEFVDMVRLSPGQQNELLKFAEGTDNVDDIVKFINKNDDIAKIITKGTTDKSFATVLTRRAAEGLLILEEVDPKLYKAMKGSGVARRIAGKIPVINRIPGVKAASGLKIQEKVWESVGNGLFKNANDYVSKTAPRFAEAGVDAEKAASKLKKTMRKMLRLCEKECTKAEKLLVKSNKYAEKALKLRDAGKIDKAAKYAAKAEKTARKSKGAVEVSTEVAELASKSKPTLIQRAAGRVSQSIVGAIGRKIIRNAFAKGIGAALGADSFSDAMKRCMCIGCTPPEPGVTLCEKQGVEESFCMTCIDETPVQAKKIKCGICKGAAVITWGVIAGLDFYFVTMPITTMIHAGHSASNTEAKMVSCYKFAGSKDRIYADPQNCMPDKKSLNWEEILGHDPASPEKALTALGCVGIAVPAAYAAATALGWGRGKVMVAAVGGCFATAYHEQLFSIIELVLGGANFPFPEPDCTQDVVDWGDKIGAGGTTYHVDIKGKCEDAGGDCPNIYISDSFEEVWGFPGRGIMGAPGIGDIELPAPFASVGALRADIVLSIPTMVCSWIGIFNLGKGVGCYAGFYTLLLAGFQAAPGATANFVLGAGIFPHSKYYYMAFPTVINIEREYEPSTGKSWINIRKGE